MELLERFVTGILLVAAGIVFLIWTSVRWKKEADPVAGNFKSLLAGGLLLYMGIKVLLNF